MNVSFGPNNMQFQNYVDRRDGALTTSNLIISGPARWFFLAHRSLSAVDKKRASARGSWLAGKVVFCIII